MPLDHQSPLFQAIAGATPAWALPWYAERGGPSRPLETSCEVSLGGDPFRIVFDDDGIVEVMPRGEVNILPYLNAKTETELMEALEEELGQ